MSDDTLRDQVAKAVCSIAIGSERVETVMEIIQEHTAEAVQAERERAEQAIESMVEHYPEDVFPPISKDEYEHASVDRISAHAMRHAYRMAARIARDPSEATP